MIILTDLSIAFIPLYGLSVYLLLVGSEGIFGTILDVANYTTSLAPGQRILNSLFESMIRFPMSFFDVTRIGDIIHKFTKDKKK
jgi:ABC-type multidrug transport system fused ATPase/permease subunit